MNFYLKKIIVLILVVLGNLVCLAFITSEVCCQSKQIRFKQITVEQGLSHSWVRCVFKDSYGYMWFGTGNNGLNKYDGYNFRVYKNNPKNNNTLSNNTINVICEDIRKNIWVGTLKGLNKYNRELDQIEPVPLFNNMYINGIHELENGKFFITTLFDFFIYDPVNNIKQSIYNNGESLPYEFFSGGIIHLSGRIFLVSTREGLYVLDASDYSFTKVLFDKNNRNINIRSELKDSDGGIWLGTFNKGLYYLTFKDRNYYEADFKHFQHDYTDKNSLSTGAINALQKDKNGNLWIANEINGLDVVNKKDLLKGTPVFYHNRHNPDNSFSLSNNSVGSLLVDDQGTLWIGTFNGGVNYYNSLLFKFDHIQYVPHTRNSLNDNNVNVFYEEKNKLWIGTEKGLNIYDRKRNEWQHYTHSDNDETSIGSNGIWAIYRDSRGLMWIGTWAGGLNLFNEKSKTFTRFQYDPSDNNSIGSNNVFGILEDNKGDLWISTMGGGLNKFYYNTKKFRNYREGFSANNFNNIWIKTSIYSSYNEIWIATSDGVNVFDPVKEEFKRHIFDSSEAKSIKNEHVVTIKEDSKKNIWIGTQNGLYLYDRKQNNFISYNEEDGIPNNVIRGICEDNNGNLWISTNKGISKFVNAINIPQKPEFINYDVNDGLQGNEFNSRSCIKGSNGLLYFGGNNGFNIINPDKIPKNPYPARVVFTDFLIFNKKVEIGSKNSPLKKHISLTEEIYLHYKQSVFTINYAALDFLAPEKNKYAYYLDGFDKEWNYVDDKLSATYTNLDPGKYTFKVKAANNDGLWNDNPAYINIIILPPWWMTLWFRILSVLFILSLFTGFYYYRMNEIRKRNKELEETVSERTREIREKNMILTNKTNELNEINVLLEERQQKIEEQTEELRTSKEELEDAFERVAELNSMKDKFFSIIGHDLKNPINTILGFSELLEKRIDKLTEEKKLKYIQAISESSKKTYELLKNLLDWARSQSGRYKYSPRSIVLKETVEGIVLLFKEQYSSKGIDMKIDIDDDITVYADQNMFDTILRNLISNAVKFTPNKGKIHISGTKYSDTRYIQVTVADSGTGIPKDRQDQLFRIDSTFSTAGTSGEQGTGLGLILCSEFIAKNNGKIWVESEEGKGSKFFFTLPLSE